MKLYSFGLTSAVILIITACHTSKKTTTSTASTEVKTVEVITPTPTVAVIPETMNKTADGVYQPGVAELAAVQERYKDVSMSHIQEGYYLYAKGACTKCHGTANIYKYDEIRWAGIIDRMALEAKISTEQKKLVFFYVMSIKAAKDKEARSER